MIELFTSNFNPYAFVKIKIWEFIFLIVDCVYFFEYVIFENSDTFFFKRMDFFIDIKFTFIDGSLRIFIANYLLKRTKILSPMIHDGEILLIIRKWLIFLKFLLSWFIFTSLILLHFLSILFELYIVLCLFYLIYILLQSNLFILWLVHILSWTFLLRLVTYFVSKL